LYIVPFGAKVEHEQKLYDGIEVSLVGDSRDFLDHYFDAKLVNPHVLLFKIPTILRDLRDHHDICLACYNKNHPAYEAVILGHHEAHVHFSEEINRIRFVALVFPNFYELSNDVFSPNAVVDISSQKKHYATSYKYLHKNQSYINRSLFRVAWLFNKKNLNAPRASAKIDQKEPDDLSELDEMIRGMNF
jgi:hypothetical protein